MNSCQEHEYIDLGLPSGTLWAACNVGANTPEGYGDYFAWGETQPKDFYNWATYKFGSDVDGRCLYTKYCNNPIWGYNGFPIICSSCNQLMTLPLPIGAAVVTRPQGRSG